MSKLNGNGKRIVAALGGNAILQPGQKADYLTQLNNVEKSCEVLARLIEQGNELIITHGNGPQVGALLMASEEASHVTPPMPLDVLSGQSQGFIGYMIVQSLTNQLIKLGVKKPVINLLTRVLVSKDDERFKNPSKPIGSFYTEEQAKKMIAEKGWTMKEDAGRGYRRVTPSPFPLEVLEKDIIKTMSEKDTVVIAGGGGGIPVIKETDGSYTGIEGVIDKDLTGCVIAKSVDADIFMILTDVENAYINYGKPEQQSLHNVSVSEMEKYVAEGHFAEGSMAPKINAAIDFVKSTGGKSYICSLFRAQEALEGKSGTIVSRFDV